MGQKDKLVDFVEEKYKFERKLIIPVVEEVVGQGMSIDDLPTAAAYLNENYWKVMGGEVEI